MVTRILRIEGRVQGVGYRYAMRREALRLGIRGWVRNRADGSVEALAHGTPQAADALAEWARRGPPGARVTRVQVEPAADAPGRECAGFEQLPTA
jgi:acylphosphatase